MPTNRTRRTRAWQATLDDYRRQQLIEGPDECLIAGVGYLTGRKWFREMTEAEQAEVLTEMERDWRVHGPDLMAWWNAGEDAPRFSPKPWIFPRTGSPDRQPWAAQHFANPRWPGDRGYTRSSISG